MSINVHTDKPARLLRQLGTGAIFIWTPVLAARKDMVPYDAETAKKRIEALKAAVAAGQAAKEPDSAAVKQHEAELADAQKLAKELTQLEAEVFPEDDGAGGKEKGVDEIQPKGKLENEVASEAELEAKRRDEVVAKDPHVIRIMGMKKKSDVAAYLLQEFGEEVEGDPKLTTLQNRAVQLRTERLFETDNV